VRLEKSFEVDRPPEVVARIASLDETLLSLFADSKTEIVAREALVQELLNRMIDPVLVAEDIKTLRQMAG